MMLKPIYDDGRKCELCERKIGEEIIKLYPVREFKKTKRYHYYCSKCYGPVMNYLQCQIKAYSEKQSKETREVI